MVFISAMYLSFDVLRCRSVPVCCFNDEVAHCDGQSCGDDHVIGASPASAGNGSSESEASLRMSSPLLFLVS